MENGFKIDSLKQVILKQNDNLGEQKIDIDNTNNLIETILERLDKVRRTPSNTSSASSVVDDKMDSPAFATLEYLDEKVEDIIRNYTKLYEKCFKKLETSDLKNAEELSELLKA